LSIFHGLFLIVTEMKNKINQYTNIMNMEMRELKNCITAI